MCHSFCFHLPGHFIRLWHSFVLSGSEKHKHNEIPSCQGKCPWGDGVQIWTGSGLRLMLRIRLGLGMSRRQAQGCFKRMKFHKLFSVFWLRWAVLEDFHCNGEHLNIRAGKEGSTPSSAPSYNPSGGLRLCFGMPSPYSLAESTWNFACPRSLSRNKWEFEGPCSAVAETAFLLLDF